MCEIDTNKITDVTSNDEMIKKSIELLFTEIDEKETLDRKKYFSQKKNNNKGTYSYDYSQFDFPCIPQKIIDEQNYFTINKIMTELTDWLFNNYEKYKNPIIVMDIDGTVLDNNFFIVPSNPNDHNAYYPSIKPVYDFVCMVNILQIPIYFVTGRLPDTASVTINNLILSGYDKRYAGIYFQIPNKGIAESKKIHRQILIKEGCTILLNIGDRNLDLEGDDLVIKKVKLPNQEGLGDI